jgi:hypothetical protein
LNAVRKVFEKTFRIVVKISGVVVANIQTAAAKNTLIRGCANLYIIVSILIRDVGRFNWTNADATVASDTFIFFKMYTGIIGKAHNAAFLLDPLYAIFADEATMPYQIMYYFGGSAQSQNAPRFKVEPGTGKGLLIK